MQPFESLPETRNLLDRSERSIERAIKKNENMGQRTSSFHYSKPDLGEKLPLAQTNFLGSQPAIQEKNQEDSKAGKNEYIPANSFKTSFPTRSSGNIIAQKAKQFNVRSLLIAENALNHLEETTI